ncbi:MAG: AAA family ATPase [Caldilineaceae bacterium SB0666_bin_21]|nr:AAA family ATPase [Caldilineaceae bacterium SB0666_bin_21]
MQCWTSPSHPPTEHGELPFLHPDQSGFIPIRRGGGLYVDKTDHLRRLLAPIDGDGSRLQMKYAFFARPRRFGKTLLVSTLEAYFQGDLPRLESSGKSSFDPDAGERSELFRDTAVEDVVNRSQAHPVVRLNMALTASDSPEGLRARLLEHLEDVYTDWHIRGVATGIEPRTAGGTVRFPPPLTGSKSVSAGGRLVELLRVLERSFKAKPVVLIDEYDSPLTHLLGRNIDPEPFIAVLREFFGLLKHLEERLHFVFITGISRFAHVNLFSALNNLKDISWDPDYADLCGFTEADLQGSLRPYLQAGAGNLGKPIEIVTQELRDHYNGYCFGHPGLSENVYNPFSLLTCLRDMQETKARDRWRWLGWPNYWSESGTPQFLVRMARNGDLALTREPPPVHQLTRTTYDLNNIDYGSLMLQTGYFTLRLDRDRLRYDYPNNEVRLTFASRLLEDFGRYAATDELTALHRALAEEDYNTFCARLHTFMAGIPGEKIANEADCHLILHALCQLMRVEFQSEVHQLGGRSDLEVVFPGHVCVAEFKYNAPPQIAL